MQRVLLNSSATITETLLDGTGALPSSPPTTAEVTITNDAGDELATGATATATGNPSEFSVDITSAMTAQLDRLTLMWSHADIGPTITFVEVVGGFLFTVAQLRAVSPVLQNATNYPTKDLLAMRTTVEDAIESELGYALVPRYAHDRTTNSYVRLRPYLRAIRSVTSDTATVDASSLTYASTGFLTGYTWTGVTDVAYEHGLDAAPPRATQEGLTLARSWLVSGPIDDRVTTVSSPDTGITSVLAVPGRGGSVFGVPSVDQYIQSERLPAVA